MLSKSTPAERERLLEKASWAGVTPDDLTNSLLSDREMSILEKEVSLPAQLALDKRILQAPSTDKNGITIRSGIMPDYALWPTIYMQQDRSWCRAGVIQTVLMYIKGSSPSQSEIIDKCLAKLPDMATYINARKPDDYANYVYALYGGDQEKLDYFLAYDVLNYQPMIFAMKNDTTSTANWPYRTGGHYSICAGQLTWANDLYFIGDPYYFTNYVSNCVEDPSGPGYHKKTWTQLNRVITNSHGEGNQHIVW